MCQLCPHHYILAEVFALVSLGECLDQPDLKKKETYFGMEEREGKETKRQNRVKAAWLSLYKVAKNIVEIKFSKVKSSGHS